MEDRRSRLREEGLLIEQGDEVEMRANETISRLESGRNIAKLESEFWLSTGLLVGAGRKHRFSTWDHDG